jgi:hypothetical protein
MKTATSWMRGGIVRQFFVALVALVAPATGRSAENLSFQARTDTKAIESGVELPAVAPILAPDLNGDPFPSHTYGNLEDVACIVALENRHIPYERFGLHARGVQTPVRLMGPLHGIRFQHAEAPDWLHSARREILDCRLVLALDDLASLLAPSGITTVLHYGIYRDDLPLPSHGRALHHLAGLAIDVAALLKDDGTRLEVQRDWRGHPGQRTCEDGFKAGAGAGGAATGELRAILCEVVREKLFHQVLTPNHDAAHWNHFHLEVMRGTEWTLVE